jgi:hypothetical protein
LNSGEVSNSALPGLKVGCRGRMSRRAMSVVSSLRRSSWGSMLKAVSLSAMK